MSAVVAFFIDAERPAANPWLLFIIGVGLAVVGIILIVLDRSVMNATWRIGRMGTKRAAWEALRTARADG